MTDELSVDITPARLDLERGAGKALLATATRAGAEVEDAKYTWALPGNRTHDDRQVPVVVDVDGSGVGLYTVTATQGGETATKTVEVTLLAPEAPALWYEEFANKVANWLIVAVVVAMLPTFTLAFRGAWDNWPRSVVASAMVGAGLLALAAAAFLVIIDYRGRMLDPERPPSKPGLVVDPEKWGTAIKGLLDSMSKALRGATALLMAAVAILFAAGWTAVGGNPGDRPPASSTSTVTTTVPAGTTPGRT